MRLDSWMCPWSGAATEDGDGALDLTVLIQTSPLPSHPSTALLDALFASLDRVDGLKGCRIVILADGCGGDGRGDGGGPAPASCNFKHGDAGAAPGVGDAYRLHLDEVQRKVDGGVEPYAPSAGGSVRLLRLPRRFGSAGAVAEAFRLGAVATGYVVVGQHDNFFVRDVPYLRGLIDYMDREEGGGWLNCVHFPSTATLRYEEKTRRRYGIDLGPFAREVRLPGGAARGRLVPLVFWYGRTSLARTRYYEEFILPRFEIRVRDHLEELWGTTQLGDLTRLKGEFPDAGGDGYEEAFRGVHAAYGNYVFLESGAEDEEVLYHLSGRKAVAAPSAPHGGVGTPVVHDEGLRPGRGGAFEPRGGSYTVARRATARVPGLAVVEAVVAPGGPGRGGQGRRPRFRQRCFHCGEKGHSFRFCPELLAEGRAEAGAPAAAT